MQTYLFALDCFDKSSTFLDSLHSWKLVADRKRENIELWNLFWTTTGTSANDSWYNCYLF